MKKFFSFILFIILTVTMAFPLGGCDFFDNNPTDKFPDLTVNQNAPIESKYIQVTPTWKYTKLKSGYYETITLKVVSKGYSELTYYDVEIEVTFTATLITDDAPSGVTFSQTVVCSVDNKGNGEKTVSIPQVGCRAINGKSTSKLFSGSVTRIA